MFWENLSRFGYGVLEKWVEEAADEIFRMLWENSS